jgi:hypothetical protein
MDDWTTTHEKAALKQGWQLTDSDSFSGRVEIRCVSDGHFLEDRTETENHDYAAVSSMKAAYMNDDDHAMLAYMILKYNNHMEFQHWAMETWPAQKEARKKNLDILM